MDNEKIRKDFGYEGKSKEYQRGFDALLRHLPSYILTGMQEERREERYRGMSEEKLRADIDRFAKEVQEQDLDLREVQAKTNSIRYALLELLRRDLPVEPVVVSTQQVNYKGDS